MFDCEMATIVTITLALTSCFIWANNLIMNTPKYHLKTIKQFFNQQKIATLDEIKAALGSPARCTIFRKLADLQYLSSYSHRGKYYTLQSIAQFNELGLWSYLSIRFSCFGNLIDTAQNLVHRSQAGYSAAELKDIVHVKTKHALIQLVRFGRLQRQQIGSTYIYLSADDTFAQQQQKARKIQIKQSFANLVVSNPDLAEEQAKATIILFCSMLNEQQRRLYAGLESLKLGYGGDAHIASLLGMDPHTVSRGRKELLSGNFNHEKLRAPGGGRLPQEKKRPKS